MHHRSYSPIVLGLSFIAAGPALVAAEPKLVRQAAQPVVELIRADVAAGRVVGAQLVIGTKTSTLVDRWFGTRGVADPTAVDRDTRFCIGSCSKPLAALCILRLAADKKLTLDDPIDRWLPEFKAPRLVGEKVVRAPTLRELLAHRGGIYSQRERLSPRQNELIRNFRQTLAEAVDGIAAERLIAEPGTTFAYSGAGYCVAGRVAEVAAGRPFDIILRETVCRPLGLKRTGYFLTDNDPNVANGGARRKGQAVPALSAPDLAGHAHRLALVGGSIYATAGDLGAFARMVLGGGRVGNSVVLPDPAWQEYAKPQFPGQAYGLGWSLRTGPGGEVSAVSHNGAQFCYRGQIEIDLAHGCYLVILVTLNAQGEDDAANVFQTIRQTGHRVLAEIAASRAKD